jgi:glutamine amidotransferase
MIYIINYKLGNITSIVNALNYLNIKNQVISTTKEFKFENSSKIIIPGVGSFKNGIKKINELNFNDLINEMALLKKVPILGICLGMQLIAKSSQENGYSEGLGLIDDEVTKFDNDLNFSVPHVGFNSIEIIMNNSALFKNIDNYSDFYFTHSYKIKHHDQNYVSGICNYQNNFCASIEKNNIFGVQFHPEKSQSNGLKLLQNFANL